MDPLEIDLKKALLGKLTRTSGDPAEIDLQKVALKEKSKQS
jgi:hypothetical protein